MKINYNSRQFLLIVAAVFFTINFNYKALSQKKDSTFSARNTIYADFASKGAYYSINFDRIFNQKGKLCWTYRLGFSILENAIAFPIGINAFTGKENSHMEFSLSLIPYVDKYQSLFSDNDLSDKFLYIVPGVGYRYQKPNGDFFFKAVLSPTILLDPPSNDFWKMDPQLHLTASLGLGVSF